MTLMPQPPQRHFTLSGYNGKFETIKLPCWHDVQVERIIRPSGEMRKFSTANATIESNFKEGWKRC